MMIFILLDFCVVLVALFEAVVAFGILSCLFRVMFR